MNSYYLFLLHVWVATFSGGPREGVAAFSGNQRKMGSHFQRGKLYRITQGCGNKDLLLLTLSAENRASRVSTFSVENSELRITLALWEGMAIYGLLDGSGHLGARG